MSVDAEDAAFFAELVEHGAPQAGGAVRAGKPGGRSHPLDPPDLPLPANFHQRFDRRRPARFSFSERHIDGLFPSTLSVIRAPPVTPMIAAGTPNSRASAWSRSPCSGRTDTTTREADSPNSVAATRKAAGTSPADGSSTATPNGVSKQHSASVTASPPSAQSCADSIKPSRMARTTRCCSARSRARSRCGGRPSHGVVQAARGIRCRPALHDCLRAAPPAPRRT